MFPGRSTTSPLAHSSFEDIDAAGLDGGQGSRRGAEGTGLSGVDLGNLPSAGRRPPIDPELALELRVRWLEAIVFGLKQDGAAREKEREKGKGRAVGETLARMAENVQNQLNAAVESNEGLQKFMQQCTFTLVFSLKCWVAHGMTGLDDKHSQFLTPTFALSGVLQDEAPSYSELSQAEVDAFLAEMEPDLRVADSDLREIGTLVKKGVTSAGKLSGRSFPCFPLEPKLRSLVQTMKPCNHA